MSLKQFAPPTHTHPTPATPRLTQQTHTLTLTSRTLAPPALPPLPSHSGVFDCFNHCNHFCAFYWPCTLPCATGQVAAAMAYTPVASRGGGEAGPATCRTVGMLVIIGCIFGVLYSVFWSQCVVGSSEDTANNCGSFQMTVLNSYEFVISCLSLVLCYIGYRMRSHLRTVLRLPGSDCDDCTMAWCCLPCVMTQMAVQLDVVAPCSTNFPNVHPSIANRMGRAGPEVVVHPGQPNRVVRQQRHQQHDAMIVGRTAMMPV